MNKKQTDFIEMIWSYYKMHGRKDLPWRKDFSPYEILVSEFMLQQTQVERVVSKYKLFLKKFPTVKDLAQAQQSEVIQLWQGLGYNRRALYLYKAAITIKNKFNGHVPENSKDLIALSGVGAYTASAILVFAFNIPVAMIETNIRAVFLHHFFKNKSDVSDLEVIKYIEATVDLDRPREWYWALMDYGSFLKKEHKNPNRRSKHHVVQSRFEGSSRQIRGAIIRTLCMGSYVLTDIISSVQSEDVRVKVEIRSLLAEGLVKKKGELYSLK